jgi:hypothetical protein
MEIFKNASCFCAAGLVLMLILGNKQMLLIISIIAGLVQLNFNGHYGLYLP